MPKRRWDRKKRRMQKQPRAAVQRAERVDVYYDPETKMLFKRGPDHGTEERQSKDGGIVIGARLMGLAQTAWVVAPGALELLRHEGGLTVGLQNDALAWEKVRRWMEAAETLRGLATRAGVQKRLTGRYDFGAVGKGEMSEKAVAAFARLTTLAERMTWSRLGPLLDLVLFDNLPPGLRRPVIMTLPAEGDEEFAAFLTVAGRNPAAAEAMARAVRESERLYPARLQVWEQACCEVQRLLEHLAQSFGLQLPRAPQ